MNQNEKQIRDGIMQFLENKILLWLAQIIAAVALAIGGYILNSTLDRIKSVEEKTHQMELWRAETASNRFTSNDGLAIWKEIAIIREQIAKMPTEVPPQWFVARVDRLEQQVNSNAIKMDEIAVEIRQMNKNNK